MCRDFPHTDAAYNADLEAARAAYTASGGNDSPQAIANYRDACSKAMADAARRHAEQLKGK